MSSIKRTARALTKTAVAALAFGLVSGLAQAEPINWRLTTFSPEGNADFRECVAPFIRNVEKLTSGQIKIQAFGAGILAPAFETAKAVQNGIADAGIYFPAFMVNEDPANAFLAGLPGGMPADATMAWIFYGGGRQLWENFRREKMGLHPVVACIGPTEVFAHAHKPLTKAEDFKGLKIRTTGAWAAILKDYFGASPVTLPGGEIFTALDRKVIDATEYVTPSINYATGLQNIAKYVMVPGIHQPTYVYEFMVKTETWDKLPADLKEKLVLAGQLTMIEGLMKLSVDDIDTIAKMKAEGKNVFLSPEPSLVEAVKKYGREWAMKTAKKQADSGNTWMEKFANSYYPFQDKWVAAADIRVVNQ
ncbi:TRAP transporter substrate-binding protein DctP [Xanthobacter sp. KR7-225]|uniref:TRAP transporter substrate-binding protein DctP n=1 Tax=Xanthobacter sp. KR7-225 TaxID=3156613 RepID=UPI0032B3CD6F